eukprot:ctg_442.g138
MEEMLPSAWRKELSQHFSTPSWPVSQRGSGARPVFQRAARGTTTAVVGEHLHRAGGRVSCRRRQRQQQRPGGFPCTTAWLSGGVGRPGRVAAQRGAHRGGAQSRQPRQTGWMAKVHRRGDSGARRAKARRARRHRVHAVGQLCQGEGRQSEQSAAFGVARGASEPDVGHARRLVRLQPLPHGQRLPESARSPAHPVERAHRAGSRTARRRPLLNQ